MDIVFLDQNKWIELAQVHSGRIARGPIAELLLQLVDAVQRKRVLFPLSASNIMEISKAQFEEIAECLPRQRGNVSRTNLQVLNAILYVAEHGCKWRGLPKRFGNWHTIYTRMNRWAKSGVLDRAFEQLQRAQIVQIKLEAVSLDSTSVKVHPDGTGAPKKTARKLSASPVVAGTPRSTSSRRTRARP